MSEVLSREEQLFDAARQIPGAAKRADYLSRACDGDDDLRQRIESLLAASPAADQWFDGCRVAAPFAADESSPLAAPTLAEAEQQRGACIGPYRIADRIGEGGCGLVFLAEQETPVRRRVALKIIKLGMDTRAVVARFNAERQALAMMDHPNIAKVFEAGATHSGRPYFAMEFVGGVKITEFCDKAKLDLAARLELFIQVCHAIQHAHQKGVVHRDIKPSNILVAWQDGAPAPKVIDFGVAKATEEPLTDKTIYTPHTLFIGTPAYMSPEQAGIAGMDIDTRSDIYSLGVLLYEVLTGRTPFNSKDLLRSGLDEMRRVLREQEPVAPSAALRASLPVELSSIAELRQCDPARLAGVVRGDLDCIARKALEKDRARRYQTANALAMDVQRFLANEPILARPPARLYQFKKLVRRNTGVFAGVAAAAVVLIAALGTSTWLWQKEKQARQRAVAAERQEAQLRREAETRERVTHAAMLLNDQRIAEADALVDTMALRGPSVEAATVLRGLGQIHALAGQWTLAAHRFEQLLQVNEADGWDRGSLDFLECGVADVENGDVTAFRRFQQCAAARFGGTTNLVVAERLLKMNSLPSFDRPEPRLLQHWANIGSQPTDDPSREAWRAVSLALYHHRLGDDRAALTWAKQALASAAPGNCRLATGQILNAIILQRLGRPQEAARFLREGRAALDRALATPLKEGDGNTGFWFDWIFARRLLEEAQHPAGAAH